MIMFLMALPSIILHDNIKVKAASGDIALAVSDKQALNAVYSAVFSGDSGVVRINNSNYYAVVYGDGSDDAILSTYLVYTGNSTVHDALISTVTIATAIASPTPTICHIDNTDKYIVAYNTDTNVSIKTYIIYDNNGTINSVVVDTQVVVVNSGASGRMDLLRLDDNYHIYVLVYADSNSDGFIETYWIPETGLISDTANDTIEYDTTHGTYPDLEVIDSSTVVFTYMDSGTGGNFQLKTYNITISTGDIENTATDSWAYETDPYYDSTINKIGDGKYLVSFMDTANKNATVFSVNITNEGVITESRYDVLYFPSAGSFEMCQTFPVQDPTVFATEGIMGLATTGNVNEGGSIFTFNVTNTGVIGGAVIDSLIFDKSAGSYLPAVEYISDDLFSITHMGTASYLNVTLVNISKEDAPSSPPVTWEGNLTAGWTIANGHTTTSTGTNGTWLISEHLNDSLFEEAWSFSNSSVWSITDESSWWSGNYTLCANFGDPDTNLSFAVVNTSSTNRSQEVGWIWTNMTGTHLTYYWFVIYAYRNASDWDCVIHADTSFFLANFNGTDLVDKLTGLGFADLNSWDHGYFPQWEYFPDDLGGCWWKLIYNQHSGKVQFKHWGTGFMYEPEGWEVDFTSPLLASATVAQGHGFGVFDLGGTSIGVTLFDIYNLWRLNSTTNASDTMTINGNVVPTARMVFTTYNMSNFTSDYDYILDIFNTSDGDHFCLDEVRDVMRENLTNRWNLESRDANIPETTMEAEDQNDTVYYYSTLLYNIQDFNGSMPYDEYLWIWIQACNDGEEDLIDTDLFWDDCIIAIDVDNNNLWEPNDRMFWFYSSGMGTSLWQFNGYTDMFPDADFNANVWQTAGNGTANLHRYTSHVNYEFMLPLATLVKSNGYPINESDTIGLSITNFDAGADSVTVWQNWNETDSTAFYQESGENAVAQYFHGTNITSGQCGITATQLARFGEGIIVGDFQGSGAVASSVTIESAVNNSILGVGETYSLMNITVWFNNTGAGNHNNIVVNMSWWNCSCNDLDMDFVSSSLDITNFTWHNDSCYVIINDSSLAPLTPASTWTFWVIVNVTNCSGMTTATELVNTSANSTELGTDVTDASPPSVMWGRTVTSVCVTYETSIIDVQDIASTVFNILGILFIIGAIFLIMYVVKKFNDK